MNAAIQFKPVPIPLIDMDDRTYFLTPWNDQPDNNLLKSIKQFGILHPPILRQTQNNTFCIVAGRKRITAAQIHEPEKKVFCGILPLDTAEKVIFSLILEDSRTGRSLSIAEQAVFFKKMLASSSVKETLPLLEQLGHKPQEHILNKLLKLRSLSEPAFEVLHHGIIQVKTALKLLKLNKQDQKQIVVIINKMRFGGSKQQKLIDLCSELIMRKEIPLEQILNDFPLTVEEDKPLNIPQYGAALLSWLHDECYPRSTQAESSFKQRVARLNPPDTMHISHTRSFEDGEISLSLRFDDWHSLENVFNKIKNIIQNK